MDNEYRLIGVPGAGKTTTLKRRIEKLVSEEGYDPSDIITTSFSRAGAREIAGRVNLPEENCATLHSFCFRALGLKKEQVADGNEANLKNWAQVAPQYALSGKGGETALEVQPVGSTGKTLGDHLMAEYQWNRARLIPREAWSKSVRDFAQAWEDFKDQNGLIDFTDMIEMCEGSMLPRCAWLFVDEAQDMSPLELRLVRDWGRYVERYILAGDPNQAIYHFKGADGEGFYNPPIPPERTHVLKRSWRLPPQVVKEALYWQTYPTPIQPNEGDGLVIRTGESLRRPDYSLRALEKALETEETVMFLASAGYLLGPLIAELKRRSLPFHNPYQITQGMWNPLRRETLGALEEVLERRARLGVVWKLVRHLPAHQVFHRNRKGMLEKEAKARGGPIMSAEVLSEYLLPHAVDALLSGDPWALVNLLYLGGDDTRSLRYALEVIARHGIEAARNPRIVVGTIHSVKGGEADQVFLWPDLSPAASKAWHASEQDRAATQRAIYVGMTRARKALYLGRYTELGVDWWRDAPRLATEEEEDDVIVI